MSNNIVCEHCCKINITKMEKICKKCYKILPKIYFSYVNKKKGYLKSWCKSCDKLINKTHYNINKTKINKYRKTQYYLKKQNDIT